MSTSHTNENLLCGFAWCTSAPPIFEILNPFYSINQLLNKSWSCSDVNIDVKVIKSCMHQAEDILYLYIWPEQKHLKYMVRQMKCLNEIKFLDGNYCAFSVLNHVKYNQQRNIITNRHICNVVNLISYITKVCVIMMVHMNT